MLKDNPKYVKQFEAHGYSIYVPANASDYHITRHVEAMKHNIYASCGITKESLTGIVDAVLERCNNDGNSKQWRTEIGNLMAYLKACTKTPVDEHCAIRLGACLSFIETFEDEAIQVWSENPDMPELFYQKEKEKLAFKYPEFYAFFLTLGISSSPEYSELSAVLTDTGYFRKRQELLSLFLPTQNK